MQIVIILTKEVADIEEGQQIYDWLKHVIEPQTELEHRAHITQDMTPLDGIPPGG